MSVIGKAILAAKVSLAEKDRKNQEKQFESDMVEVRKILKSLPERIQIADQNHERKVPLYTDCRFKGSTATLESMQWVPALLMRKLIAEEQLTYADFGIEAGPGTGSQDLFLIL